MELIDHTLPRGVKEFTLAPVGDIQYGAKGCAEGMLKKHIEYGIEHDWLFLGMGDYLDTFSPSNRRALIAAKASLYDSARELVDDAIYERVRALAAGPLAGSEGKWAGMIQGDHTWTFEDGQPADALLAAKLKAPYLGHSAVVQVFAQGISTKPLRIFVTHGAGSSVSSTGKSLHLERILNNFDVDVVLMGHSHLKYVYPKDRLKWVELPKGGTKLVHETKMLGITGSFLKGYEEHTSSGGWPAGSYVEAGAMAPVPLGGITIQARLVKEPYGFRWDMFGTA